MTLLYCEELSSLEKMASRKHNALLVTAMDFGTTYSGYAFSFRDTPKEFQTPQTWYAGSAQLVSMKTPTCLLLKSNKEFHSFGYEAENKYADLAADENHHGWYFFQHFKMVLHNNSNLSKSTRVEDITGKPMQALKVFSLSIEYLKNHLIRTLNNRTTGIDLKDIHFVITVPAIWNDTAKQFMREAAIEAGIESNQLTLAFEPEAASIFCQHIPTEKSESSGVLEAKTGTEYMVVDLGGGTVDITVHKKKIDGTLKALHAATGGPWGGLMVNNEFLKVLTEIFSDKVMKRFKEKEMGDYYELLRVFETKKRTIDIEADELEKFTIRIFASLKEIYVDCHKASVEEAIAKSKYHKYISLMSDKLRIDMNFMKQLFQPSIESVLFHVSQLLRKPQLHNVGLILLVGGYSECLLVQKGFKDMFGGKRVVIPHDGGLAIVKGAVYFGHLPNIVSERILSYTYGICYNPVFDQNTHPEQKRFTDSDGTDRCQDVFSVYKRKGDPVKAGERVTHKYQSKSTDQKLDFMVYSSTESNPKLVTDEGCTCLENIKIPLQPYSGEERPTTCDFIFGDTEILVEVINNYTKQKEHKYVELQQ